MVAMTLANLLRPLRGPLGHCLFIYYKLWKNFLRVIAGKEGEGGQPPPPPSYVEVFEFMVAMALANLLRPFRGPLGHCLFIL